MRVGRYELAGLVDGFFAVDGGALFGVVPRPVWERKLAPDARNRIRLAEGQCSYRNAYMKRSAYMDRWARAWLTVMGISLALFVTPPAEAHCDTMGGPVVADAKVALEKKDVTPALKWVNVKDEREIRELFTKTLKVRAHGSEARELADRYFFETLVRVHRAGEGAGDGVHQRKRRERVVGIGIGGWDVLRLLRTGIAGAFQL